MNSHVNLQVLIPNLPEYIEQSTKVAKLARQLELELEKLNQIELSVEVNQ